MTFTFVHTADWQLGKPFRNFTDRAPLLEQARFDCIGRIAEVARNAGARHILVAGDVFDNQQPAERTLARALDRLGSARDLTWHLLPGNHDPATPAGIWERLRVRGLPSNVRPHDHRQPHEIEPGIVLLPSPLTTVSQSADPTAWLDTAETPAGVIRIGLAHGSVRDFSSESDSATLIEPARARLARLDYLALGDWHGVTRIDARTWYAGTPEPDRFRDNAPGFALIVAIDAPGSEPRVERVRTAQFSWVHKQAEITSLDRLASLEADLLTGAPQPDRLLLKLSLAGAVSALERDGIDRWIAAFGERLCHLEADTAGLLSTLGPADIETLELSADVRLAAERLQARTREGDEKVRRTAEKALGWLIRLSRDQTTGGGQ